MMYSNSFLAKASNWFLLGVILVVFLVPSMAIGTVDRSLTQEGDPEDGLGYTDSGGGGSGEGAEYPNSQPGDGIVPGHILIYDLDFVIYFPGVGIVWTVDYSMNFAKDFVFAPLEAIR